MVGGATGVKALDTLAKELAFMGRTSGMSFGTDSNAANSFVSRRGVGRMSTCRFGMCDSRKRSRMAM